MPDEITRLSEALARDPSGMGWVPLADALRRARRLPAAERTALRGLERHPYHADGHDVLARIAADGGDLGRARDEWEMAVRLDPRHVGARLGLGWLAHRSGDREGAQRWWRAAHEIAPADPRVVAAGRQLQAAAAPPSVDRVALVPAAPPPPVDRVAVAPAPLPLGARPTPRPLTPSDESLAPSGAASAARAAEPRRGAAKPAVTSSLPQSSTDGHAARREVQGDARAVFASIVRGGATFALLVDDDGLVLAGDATVPSGADRGDVLAAELSGLSAETAVALQQLQLGTWEHLLVEGEARTLAFAPSAHDTLTLVATAAGTPAGLPRLLLDRARQRACDWMEAL